MPMKLSDWARRMNISYTTAWRWWRDGKIPFPVKKIGGSIIVMEDEKDQCSNLRCPKCGEYIEVHLK